MRTRLVALLLVSAVSATARASPAFDLPFEGQRATSAGFDLDRAPGAADWRGWTSDDPDGAHAPHPYDGHSGVDFPMPDDTPVLAPAEATVLSYGDGAPYDDAHAANWLQLRHPDRRLSLLWHLAPGLRTLVRRGAAVRRGDVVARSDNTGRSTGPHLHFGEFTRGAAVCPFERASFRDPAVAGRIYCATDDLPLASHGSAEAPEVATLASRRCGIAVEERDGWARFRLPSPTQPITSRLRSGCVSPAIALEGPWLRTVAQSPLTRELAHGSLALKLPDRGSVTVSLPVPRPLTATIELVYPGAANALVEVELRSGDGLRTIALAQTGRPAGTREAPVDAGPRFTDDHTTAGGRSDLLEYACDPALDTSGPERVHRVRLDRQGRLFAQLLAGDGTDLALFLLSALDPAACVSHGTAWVAADALPAGVYWIVVDTRRVDGRAAAGAYRLAIDAPTALPAPEYGSDRWLSLGEHDLVPGATLRLVSKPGPLPLPDRPGRLALDAIRLRTSAPATAWAPLAKLVPAFVRTVVAFADAPYFPLFSAPGGTGGLVAVVGRGQYAVSPARQDGSVAVELPGLDAPAWADERDVVTFDDAAPGPARVCAPDDDDPLGEAGDRDRDGLLDVADACPDAFDPGSPDRDGDGLGDACDPCPDDTLDDADGDGACDGVDLCPTVPDPAQRDDDADGVGNACDPCPFDALDDPDGDDRCSRFDTCPELADPEQSDRDGDGFGDPCDACPDDPRPGQPAETCGVPEVREGCDCRHSAGGFVMLVAAMLLARRARGR